jgi:hypothetical protein
MPRAPSSAAKACVIPITAAFEVAYALMFASPRRPAIDARLTTQPPDVIAESLPGDRVLRAHVDVQHRVDEVVADVREGTCRREDPRVVDEDVERARPAMPPTPRLGRRRCS